MNLFDEAWPLDEEEAFPLTTKWIEPGFCAALSVLIFSLFIYPDLTVGPILCRLFEALRREAHSYGYGHMRCKLHRQARSADRKYKG